MWTWRPPRGSPPPSPCSTRPAPCCSTWGDHDVDLGGWADRIRLVRAHHDGRWELPVLGEVEAPPAVLVRPDGHVAWVGDPAGPDLHRALATWFGPGDDG